MSDKEKYKICTEPLDIDGISLQESKEDLEIWYDCINLGTLIFKSVADKGKMGLILANDIKEATHWLAEEDKDAPEYSNVIADSLYEIAYDEKEEEYYVIDEEGLRSMIYLAHKGMLVMLT